MKKPSVFITSSVEGLAVAKELSRQIEASATVSLWSEGIIPPGKTAFEFLKEVASRSDFVVFVLTGAGDATARSQATTYANSFFELGVFAGQLGLSRTFVVVEGQPETLSLPSDLAGIMYLPVTPTASSGLPSALAPAAAAIRRSMAELSTRADKPYEFYSCFISYSQKDQDFASQLQNDLKKLGIRTWLDLQRLQVGGSVGNQIGQALRFHDKALIVLSEASVRSEWVRFEIAAATKREREEKKIIIFPLLLDRVIFNVDDVPEFSQLKQRFMLDFEGWQDDHRYRRAFSHLVRSLAISASVESGGLD